MTPLGRGALLWGAGLAAFAGVVALSQPLAIPAVPGGLLEHQAAGSGTEAGRIQAAWTAAGLERQAQIAMLADIVFIGLYALGAARLGRALRAAALGTARTAAGALVVAAALFAVTDYAETLAQIAQLMARRGNDTLAGLAAAMQPIKSAAFLATLVLALGGLAAARLRARKA